MTIRVVSLAALVFAGGLVAPAQQPAPTPEQTRAETPDTPSKDVKAVYGRIKEVKAGQKIVVQVDNARDRTYNLADKNRTITVAEDLAVGDRVKVLEAKTTKAVQIVRDVTSDSTKEERSRSTK
jgi:hypothetical protein